MNTANIKKYAPLARNAFITAVTKRANELGIYASHIEEAIEEGQVLKIEGRSVDLKLKGARNKLIQRVESTGFTALMEFIAYTWFNRLCAIRYMELHDYLDHGLRVLSHPDNNSGFEILEHAQDVAEDLGLNRDQIIELKLAGNQDELLYRTLLLGQCHALHKAMPFLFEAIDDETELLLPDNLTRTDSILRGLVNDIPAEDWEQVEIIGWLYQFYISEKKDEVIGKVVKSEDIPAATQLFTPNWIVKYLVQNSVGRQWLQTYPDSSIKAGMDYYIEPAEQTDEGNKQIKAITPDSIEPESIKVLDPACGSGHILVEAYQVLKAIYEERGYRSRDIPQLILEKNLFGLDIDDRAAQLSGFALMMLARADDKRIFTRNVQLNVMAMQEAGEDVSVESIALSSEEQETALLTLLDLFANAKTFGSLIQVPDALAKRLLELHQTIEDQIDSPDVFAQHTAKVLLPLIKQAEILARKYDAVIANPPYMGSKGMNVELKKFAKDNYPNSKSDLFAVFMEHGFSLLKDNGFNAQVNMQSWMFLSSYEKLRKWLLETKTFITMAHLGARAFSQISGEVVQTTAWVLSKNHIAQYQPVFFRLIEGNEEVKRQTLLKQEQCFDNTLQDDFKKIPSSPISYWVTSDGISVFNKSDKLKDKVTIKQGMTSGNNARYTRFWYEVALSKCFFMGGRKWYPFNKGGGFRRWFGNIELVVNYEDNGAQIANDALEGNNKGFRHDGKAFYFMQGVTWSAISSSFFSTRLMYEGAIFGNAGPTAFSSNEYNLFILAMTNSSLVEYYAKIFSPTLNFEIGDISKIPVIKIIEQETFIDFASKAVSNAKTDWDLYETSWNFKCLPLISNSTIGWVGDKASSPTYNLSDIYANWQTQNRAIIVEMQRLEQENNRLFIEAYGLEDELTPDVPTEQITLTVNPKYRYGGKLSDEILEKRFQSDTLAELISYAIGCMMGRYSLDQEGLVYAHAGNEGFTELVQQGAYKTFPADDDGIIPLTDQEWFADDATQRFREFVRVVWGEDNLQQNLDFVAESLCLYAIKAKSSESSLETIRRYLSNQFYKDHLKTYKKRPIYWLFSSGKQKAFECLVYLHRYNESTLSRMRTEYVTPLLGKYEASAMVLEKQMQDASTTAESNRLKKSLTALEKKQTELSEFDDKLKHYADMRISLDLDDGVKVNYGKFGDLLAEVKAITGKK